jgi:hypothetical protein
VGFQRPNDNVTCKRLHHNPVAFELGTTERYTAIDKGTTMFVSDMQADFARRTMGKKHHFGGHKWTNELTFLKLFSIFFGLPSVPIT